jgi:hypothetical protein
VSSNPVYGEVYSIQHYVIKFVRDMRQACGFFRFPPINKPDHHDITEILLKVTFNTITHPYFDLSSSSLYNLISDINTLSDLHRIGSYNFNSISSTPLCLFWLCINPRIYNYIHFIYASYWTLLATYGWQHSDTLHYHPWVNWQRNNYSHMIIYLKSDRWVFGGLIIICPYITFYWTRKIFTLFWGAVILW